jgi:predicted nuclease with TOPRIM domain
MKKESPLTKLQDRLEELKREEEQLSRTMKNLADNIQKNATPMGIAKGVASKMFKDKSSIASTATAALGLGASLVAGNIVRSRNFPW